jgi:hypothetical protein
VKLTWKTEGDLETEQIRAIVKTGVQELLENDRHLLETDVDERAITCMLSRYLAEQLPDWAVDCEYNRDRDRVKRLRFEDGDEELYEESRSVCVKPDIIVYRRDTDENLLVVEAKKESRGNERQAFDRARLQGFVRQFGYNYALLLKLTVGDRPDIEMEWIDS